MCPIVLNVGQFQRFMAVIKKLGERVEREHLQHLKDSQRIEDNSATALSPSFSNGGSGSLDFASLVAGARNTLVKPDAEVQNEFSWQDDVWGSILNDVSRATSNTTAYISNNAYRVHPMHEHRRLLLTRSYKNRQYLCHRNHPLSAHVRLSAV